MAKSELKKQTKQVVKIKKKLWFTILAPKILGEHPIGESYLEDPLASVGRTVKVNLMQLTGDVKSQSSEVKFKITEVKDKKIETRPIGYYFSSSTIKRFMRRHMTRIDDSIVVITKDNIKIRIKPFLLTKSKVSRSVEYALRVNLREAIIRIIKEMAYDALFVGVVKYQFQKELREKLAKIYPIKSLEIRVLEEETYHSAKETPIPVKKAVKNIKSKKEKQDDMEEESKHESSGNEETNLEQKEDTTEQ